MNYYKYMGRISSECFLKDSTIRFSQPRALNDPFELSPEIYCEESDAKLGMNFPTKYFLTGRESVVKKYLVPEDNFSKGSLMVDVKYQIEQFNTKLGVLCLTRDHHIFPKNSLMWAHYGESHSGIALKFKKTCQFVSESHEVHYVKSRPIINAKIFFENAEISIGDWFFKSDAWAYEREVRFPRHLDDCLNTGRKDCFGNDIYVRHVESDLLECVYIGANASDDLKHLALAFHNKTGVDVIYLGVGSRQYSLIPYSFNSRKSYDHMIEKIMRIHQESLVLF